jgi:hypothetical protein
MTYCKRSKEASEIAKASLSFLINYLAKKSLVMLDFNKFSPKVTSWCKDQNIDFEAFNMVSIDIEYINVTIQRYNQYHPNKLPLAELMYFYFFFNNPEDAAYFKLTWC